MAKGFFKDRADGAEFVLKFGPDVAIGKVLPKADSHYAIAYAKAIQIADDKCVVAATDGHVLALVPVDGNMGDKSGMLIPPDMLPKKNQKHKVAEFHGDVWRLGDVVAEPAPEGMSFPKYQDVVPMLQSNDVVCLTLNVDKLVSLAKALGDNVVRLLIDRNRLDGPIGVLPAYGDGLGVLMPFAGASKDEIQSSWNEKRTELLTERKSK